MAELVTPQKIQIVAKKGYERMKTYRSARAMFIKEFVGQYYSKQAGLTGDEPLNLIFHTIRSWVPNLVMENPMTEVTTDFIPQQFYGELLGMAVDQIDRDMGLKDILRAWIVSALFGLGILKTGLKASGELMAFDDVEIDVGRIYTKLVDLDDFVIDPLCTDISKPQFMGNRVRVPRQMLLDDDSYNRDLVMKLPRAKIGKQDVEDISKKNMGTDEVLSLQDLVDVVELWVPEANALVTIPDPTQIMFDDYIRVIDYYGPKEGPYTLLSFTPPVPNNPFPVSPVSLWYDIHKMANNIFKKLMEQADRQKDMLLYPPAQSDEAQAVLDGKDGDAMASISPKDLQVVSFGGQNRSNEQMMQELQIWYNYISGNPDQMAGNIPAVAKGKETATRTQVLQANANVTIEDARGILYDRTSEVKRKEAWFLHTDPFIDLPLTRRTIGGKQVQLRLTPEQRCGDFLKFTFRIVAKSMSRLDPTIKSRRMLEFGTNILPAVMNSAMIAAQMGTPFNVQRAITDLAKELQLTDKVQDWFDDPEFAQKMELIMKLGPKDPGKAGSVSNAAIMQNGGYAESRNIPGQQQQYNREAQNTASESQSSYYQNLGL